MICLGSVSDGSERASWFEFGTRAKSFRVFPSSNRTGACRRDGGRFSLDVFERVSSCRLEPTSTFDPTRSWISLRRYRRLYRSRSKRLPCYCQGCRVGIVSLPVGVVQKYKLLYEYTNLVECELLPNFKSGENENVVIIAVR